MSEVRQLPPTNPFPLAGLGIGLLIASVFLGRGPDAGLLVFVGRSLFVIGLVIVVGAVVRWIRDSDRDERERDPEV